MVCSNYLRIVNFVFGCFCLILFFVWSSVLYFFILRLIMDDFCQGWSRSLFFLWNDITFVCSCDCICVLTIVPLLPTIFFLILSSYPQTIVWCFGNDFCRLNLLQSPKIKLLIPPRLKLLKATKKRTRLRKRRLMMESTH